MSHYQQPSDASDMEPTARLPFNARSSRPRGGFPMSCLALLLGILLGVLLGFFGAFFYLSSAHDVPAPASQPVPGEAAIVVQLGPTYLSQMAAKEASQANIPGNLQHVQVKLTHDAPITITGDDQFSLFGFAITRQISMQLQPTIHACSLHISVTHADFAGIPVTSFVSTFEQQINQQLSSSTDSKSLPQGFVYCITNIHTETNGIFVTYAARPL